MALSKTAKLQILKEALRIVENKESFIYNYAGDYDTFDNLPIIFKEDSLKLFSGIILFNSSENYTYLEPLTIDRKLHKESFRILLKILSKNDIMIRDKDISIIYYSEEELYDMWLRERKIFNYR